MAKPQLERRIRNRAHCVIPWPLPCQPHDRQGRSLVGLAPLTKGALVQADTRRRREIH